MLRDLTIQNYRCFKDFHVDDLARVNLIVGPNNAGKTSLLEAVYLLVNQNNIQSLFEILSHRGETTLDRHSLSSQEGTKLRQTYQVLHIFYGHNLKEKQFINIKSVKDAKISFKIQIEQAIEQLSVPDSEEFESNLLAFELVLTYGHPIKIKIPVRSDGTFGQHPISRLGNLTKIAADITTRKQSLFLTTSNLSFVQLSELWDKITLTPKEESVVAALQILEPNVNRISFTSRQTSNTGILLKLHGQDHPIPLGSMGEGMRRILNLAMASVTVENGFLLVDEIDTGLYYRTQTDMWRLLFETAKQLNVQIFATTHSCDCIIAFQEALADSEDPSVGKLFRLSRRGEDIRAVEYTPDDLSIAVRQNIEVR
ncbi:AAA family ATPase [Microcoleus sp. FACHB-68]|uniref:AAA family ATPase n=1 Tax=Microcoleus sp. FACHB-68 TaxID=2692826 RepID=UPI001682B241|nr:AAA family ATPase [Microcoleus sp. FACHB-68]MBD1939840.1 AAA family ATPase [Microcoleus sp. FACHB-68]